MKAMNNPALAKVIKKRDIKVVKKIKSTCPECKIPGFGVTEVKQVLRWCIFSFTIWSTLSYIYICKNAVLLMKRYSLIRKPLKP